MGMDDRGGEEGAEPLPALDNYNATRFGHRRDLVLLRGGSRLASLSLVVRQPLEHLTKQI